MTTTVIIPARWADSVGPPILQLRDVRKEYAMGTQVVRALRGVDLRVDEGEFVSIVGASGSGKSTLMHIIGCRNVPTSGRYELAGEDVSQLREDALAEIRNR